MQQVNGSMIRMSALVCLAASGLAVQVPASAACAGASNTCFGTYALASNTTGILNAAFGNMALRYNTTGSYNTASGSQALWANTSGFNNTASGYLALFSNTTGMFNTASGSGSLRGNTTGSLNAAHGAEALRWNTTGSNNTASGYQALYDNSTGYNNVASGSAALSRNTTGFRNTGSGAYALRNNTAGSENTASGAYSLSSSIGSYNTADGSWALANATSGVRNVALGYQAGYAVTTGSDNIIIGAQNQGRAADNGVIRIGASAFQKRAFVAGIRGVQTGATGAVAVLVDGNGQLGTINSSRRFKEDIQPMGSVSERLFALRPVTFKYKQSYADGSKPVQFGLVAEEVAQVFPELVVYGKDGKPETVAYHVLATLLLNELQKEHRVSEQLQEQVEAQAVQLAALNQQATEVAELKKQMAALTKLVGSAEKTQMVASAR